MDAIVLASVLFSAASTKRALFFRLHRHPIWSFSVAVEATSRGNWHADPVFADLIFPIYTVFHRFKSFFFKCPAL